MSKIAEGRKKRATTKKRRNVRLGCERGGRDTGQLVWSAMENCSGSIDGGLPEVEKEGGGAVGRLPG